MKPAPFAYMRPESAAEALAALAEHGEEARVLAGGQTLMAMLNMRLVEPSVLIDISRLSELAFVRQDRDVIRIGAATTQAALAENQDVLQAVPLLARTLPYVGHHQTRNRGTVCGSLAHSDPSAELPLILAVLDGSVELARRRGRRQLSADEFQLGTLTTARGDDEMIVSATFPVKKPGARYGFREVAIRHGDFAIVAVACSITDEGTRIGVGGVADRPEVRDWPSLQGDDLDDALNDFAWELGGYDDVHATAAYRRELVRRIGKSCILEASA